MAEWTAITVTFNSSEHLRAHWSRPDERDFRWIVVDNGSTDDTLALANSYADEVVETGRNGGFSAGNNAGLDRVDTKYVLFANPDLSVPGSGWQADLARAIDDTDGLVAPQLLNPDGSHQHNARGYPFLRSKFRNRLRPDSSAGKRYARSGFQKQTFCAWVMGAAVAGETSTVRQLGGWDENYFLYYEDHELGLRAWRSGVPVSVAPEIEWVHDWQRATLRPNMRAWRAEVRSMHLFYKQHPSFLIGDVNEAPSRLRTKASTYGALVDKLWQPVDRSVIAS